MADQVFGVLHFVNNPYIWGAVITVFFWNVSTNSQRSGERLGGLAIGIPCGMVALGGLAKAYSNPDSRLMTLVGTGMATAGAVISTAPAMIKDERQARTNEAIYSTTTIATALGLGGCALIRAEGQIAVANPLAPVVQAIQQQPQPVVIVNNPMNA
jgi:hypothetical protein